MARLRRFGEHRAARFVRTAHSAGKSKARHRGNPLLLPRLWQRGDRRSQELPMDTSKRGLIPGAAGVGAAFLLPTMPAFATRKKSAGGKKPAEKEDVTPPEDLMREHGALDRVLLIYEASMRKLAAKDDFDPAILTQSAEVVRDFIEN